VASRPPSPEVRRDSGLVAPPLVNLGPADIRRFGNPRFDVGLYDRNRQRLRSSADGQSAGQRHLLGANTGCSPAFTQGYESGRDHFKATRSWDRMTTVTNAGNVTNGSSERTNAQRSMAPILAALVDGPGAPSFDVKEMGLT
jgi:hypothetical protein